MAAKLDLLTAMGTYTLHAVYSLGNQQAVVDKKAVYVVDSGSTGYNVGIALAALGAVLDLGLLAWPVLPVVEWDAET